MDDKYIGFYFFQNEMYNLLNNNEVKNITIRLYNIYNKHNDQVDPAGLSFILYGHRFSNYNECKDLKNMQNNIQEIKQFTAISTKATPYIDIELTESEMNKLKPCKGIAFSIVDKNKLTVHDVKCSLLYNIQEESNDDPNTIILYDSGTINNDTIFKNLEVSYSAIKNYALIHSLYKPHKSFWFSYSGQINFNDYDSFEVSFYTNISTKMPVTVYLHKLLSSNKYGYAGINELTASTNPLDAYVGYHQSIMSEKITTYEFTKQDFQVLINKTGCVYGHLAISFDRYNYEGDVYITKIVAKKTTTSSTPSIPSTPTVIKCTGLSFEPRSDTFRLGEYVRLDRYLNVQPHNCTDTISYSCSDPFVLKSTSISGMWEASHIGTATITARCGTKTATCTITVIQPTPYPPGTNVNNTVTKFSAYQYNPVTKTIPVEANGNYTLSFDYGPNISNQGYTASVSVRVCDANGNTVDSYNESTQFGSRFSKDLTLKKGYTIDITASISVTKHSSHCNQVSGIELIFNSL